MICSTPGCPQRAACRVSVASTSGLARGALLCNECRWAARSVNRALVVELVPEDDE